MNLRTMGGRVLLTVYFPLLAFSQGWENQVDFSKAADSLITAEVSKGAIPGAVLLVSKDGSILHRKAYGYAQHFAYGGIPLQKPEQMTVDHLFDLASMTKVLAGTMAVMKLVDEGKVDVRDPVYRYLPEFRGASKDSITVRHLLSHSGGLYQWQPLYLHTWTREGTFEQIASMPLQFPVGKQRRYSDLGFMLLGYVVERISGKPLDEFLKERIYSKIGLRSTLFNPKQGRFMGPIAATSHGNPYEYRMVADTGFQYRVIGDPSPDIFKGWRKYTLRGETNDGNAFYANQGIAGHAGLFSTADEIHRLFLLMLNEGEMDGERIFRRETVKQFLERNEFGHGLGWQWWNLADSSEVRVAGFGHTGFTGTYGVCVPEGRLIIILTTNRQNVGLNAEGYYPNVAPLQRKITRVVIGSFEKRSGGSKEGEDSGSSLQ